MGSMDPSPKLVIAHRGASGYLPEHTVSAYAMAAGQGARILEPDVVLTRDHVAICLHDVHLERVTDVAARFPDRAREDGRWYALDLDLEEIQSLAATGGERHGMPGERVPTLEAMLHLCAHLSRTLGEEVGVAPELKAPSFHRDAGAPIEDVVAAHLKDFGLHGSDAACYVQCFEADTLRRLRQEHDILAPMVKLVGKDPLTDDELDRIAAHAEILGPSKDLAARDGGELVRRCHARGLRVVPYTFKDDEDETARFLHELGVDGVFSDYPDVALRALTR